MAMILADWGTFVWEKLMPYLADVFKGMVGPMMGGFLAVAGVVVAQRLTEERERKLRAEAEAEKRLQQKNRYQEKTIHEIQDALVEALDASNKSRVINVMNRRASEREENRGKNLELSVDDIFKINEFSHKLNKVETLISRIDDDIISQTCNSICSSIYKYGHSNGEDESEFDQTDKLFCDFHKQVKVILKRIT